LIAKYQILHHLNVSVKSILFFRHIFYIHLNYFLKLFRSEHYDIMKFTSTSTLAIKEVCVPKDSTSAVITFLEFACKPVTDTDTNANTYTDTLARNDFVGLLTFFVNRNYIK